MIEPADFLDLIDSSKDSRASQDDIHVRQAVVDPSFASGRPRLTFEGESSLTQKTWPYLSSYSPAPSDRVLVLMYRGRGVILGAIV